MLTTHVTDLYAELRSVGLSTRCLSHIFFLQKLTNSRKTDVALYFPSVFWQQAMILHCGVQYTDSISILNIKLTVFSLDLQSA